jgi:hypothetical protein
MKPTGKLTMESNRQKMKDDLPKAQVNTTTRDPSPPSHSAKPPGHPTTAFPSNLHLYNSNT